MWASLFVATKRALSRGGGGGWQYHQHMYASLVEEPQRFWLKRRV